MNNTTTLEKYFPSLAVEKVLETIQKEGVKLIFVPWKKSFFGKYFCAADEFSVPIIKIADGNGKYHQLFTFVHEIAHHKVWMQTRQHHGHDYMWQSYFQRIIDDWLVFFPKEISDKIFFDFMQGDIPASSEKMVPLFMKYDFPERYEREYLRKSEQRLPDNFSILETLPTGSYFRWNGRCYEKSYRMRKNFTCFQLPDRQRWTFQPRTVVQLVTKN